MPEGMLTPVPSQPLEESAPHSMTADTKYILTFIKQFNIDLAAAEQSQKSSLPPYDIATQLPYDAKADLETNAKAIERLSNPITAEDLLVSLKNTESPYY